MHTKISHHPLKSYFFAKKFTPFLNDNTHIYYSKGKRMSLNNKVSIHDEYTYVYNHTSVIHHPSSIIHIHACSKVLIAFITLRSRLCFHNHPNTTPLGFPTITDRKVGSSSHVHSRFYLFPIKSYNSRHGIQGKNFQT